MPAFLGVYSGMLFVRREPGAAWQACERAEGDGVIQRRTARDNGTRHLDIRTGAEQRIQRFNIAAAGRAVQWRLGMRSGPPGIDVGAGCHTRLDRRPFAATH